MKKFILLIIYILQSNFLICISYNELIDSLNIFSEQFPESTLEDRLEHLLKYFTFNIHEEYECLIDCQENVTNSFPIVIAFNELRGIYKFKKNTFIIFKLTIQDNIGQNCLSGEFKRKNPLKKDWTGEISVLGVNPTFASYVYGKKRHLTGTEVIKIWDSLCNFLQPLYVTVEDSSKYDGFYLRLLRPFIRNDKFTWYGKFGYISANKKHQQAIDLLYNLTIEDFEIFPPKYEGLLKIIKKYSVMLGLLQEKQVTFGKISQTIFDLYVQSNGKNKIILKKELKVLYDTIMEYSFYSSFTEEIKSAQLIISYLNFYKIYKSHSLDL